MPTPSLADQIRQTRSEATQILDRADREKRDLTAAEEQQYARADARLDELLAQEHKLHQQQARRPHAPGAARGGDGAALELAYPGFEIPGLRGRSARLSKVAAGSPEALRGTDRYRQDFLRYLSSGREALGLKVSQDNKGGYLAPIQFVQQLIKFLDDNVFMRQLANVLPPMPSAVNIGVPSWDTDPGNADWTAEVPASDISEDDAARVGQREFMPHLLTKLVKVSMKLLRAATVIDPDSFLIERIGYKIGITEENAFLNGDGAQKPLGVFVASANGISTGRDVTASAATSFTGDDLIRTFYNVKEQYQKNGSWVTSREFASRTRRLKDGMGQYLWAPGLGGAPSTILDRPLFQSEYAPSTFTAGLYVAVFGDFKTGYMIADSLALEVQRLLELFALKNQVGMLCRKETDGAPVLEEAFSRLILSS